MAHTDGQNRRVFEQQQRVADGVRPPGLDKLTLELESRLIVDDSQPADRYGTANHGRIEVRRGQSSPSSVVNSWMSSPGHCANIMNPAFRAAGVGYAYNASASYRHYWTLTLGGT